MDPAIHRGSSSVVICRRNSTSDGCEPDGRGRRLEDVDGGEDDDPHHVDEVPVDPGHLDAEMVLRLRAVVAPPGADVRDPQQDEPDGDVGTVQAGEAVEDRSERVVPGAEADVDVLVD